MRTLFLRIRFSGFLFQVRLQETFRHLLDARVFVPPQPRRLRQVELKIAMLDGLVIAFANITKEKDAGRRSHSMSRLGRHLGITRGIARGGNGKSHCIPKALRRRPTATAGITQVAKCLEDVLRRKLAFMAGSGAVTAPSATKGKPRGMRPGTVLQSRYRHEIRAGQSLLARRNLFGLAIVIS